MTLAVAFVRAVRGRQDRQELVFASDSRLSGGQRLDFGPKVFTLPRSDALLAMAGDTAYAYPLALHLQAAIAVFPRSVDRRFPLPNARGHMLRVFEQLYRSIHSLPPGEQLPLQDIPAVQFLFGGYVWHQSAFRIWSVKLDRTQRQFRFASCGAFQFIGDQEAVREARSDTARTLRERGRTSDQIDMEPFEVLRDSIRSGRHAQVGGSPQVAKVYRHMNTQMFSVLWSNEGSTVPHVFGRPLLAPEVSAWPVFDPDALHFSADGAQDAGE